MARKLIDISHISKSYGDNLVLDDLNLYINENKFLTLLGPSGCGKTTLLRILGGFETPDNGKIIFDGKDITNLAPNKRQLNTVFQKYALFSHMSIADNIAFGLKIKGKSKAYINDKIKYALKLVNLDGFENLVFLGKNGKPISERAFQVTLNGIAKAINKERERIAKKNQTSFEPIPHFYPHALRHTFATRCFEAGIDAKVVQKFLGHYSISITLDLYTHITNEKAKEDMNKLENLYKKIV